MASYTVSDAAAAIVNKLIRKAQKRSRRNYIWATLNDTSGMAEYSSNTVQMYRILKAERQTSSFSEGSMYTDVTPKEFTLDKITTTIGQIGDIFEGTDLTILTAAARMPEYEDTVSEQMVDSLDYQLAKAVAQGTLWHRADNSTTYEKSGTADSGTTTTIVDDARTEIDDFWNAAMWMITNPDGRNYGIGKIASDFDASGDEATTAAFPQAISSTSKYHATSLTALASDSTYRVSFAGLTRMAAIMETVGAKHFDDGLYYKPIHPDIKRDYYSDSTFQNIGIYDDSKRFKNYKLVRMLDIMMPVTHNVYRSDNDGTENVSGNVYYSTLLGKHCFEAIHWGNAKGQFPKDAQAARAFGARMNKIGGYDDVDSYNPFGSKWFISWLANYAALVKNGTYGVTMVSGASAPNVLV